MKSYWYRPRFKIMEIFYKSERDYIIANVRKKSNQQQKDDRQKQALKILFISRTQKGLSIIIIR